MAHPLFDGDERHPARRATPALQGRPETMTDLAAITARIEELKSLLEGRERQAPELQRRAA